MFAPGGRADGRYPRDVTRVADDPPGLARLRAICLAQPEATERASHGEPSWFVRDRRQFAMFANRHHDDRVAFWCAAPEGAQAPLIESAPARYFRPPYVGHRGWVGVYLDVPDVDWEQVAEIVGAGYDVVAAKRR